jgi:hypothetical protein
MSQFDEMLEQIISNLSVRVAVRRASEFEAVCECVNRICDRYETTQRRLNATGLVASQPSRIRP